MKPKNHSQRKNENVSIDKQKGVHHEREGVTDKSGQDVTPRSSVDLVTNIDINELRNKKHNEGICKCGHHAKDHSYEVDFSSNLYCDICNCKDYKFDHFEYDISLCPNCNCMTKTIKNKCGKCKSQKKQKGDDDNHILPFPLQSSAELGKSVSSVPSQEIIEYIISCINPKEDIREFVEEAIKLTWEKAQEHFGKDILEGEK